MKSDALRRLLIDTDVLIAFAFTFIRGGMKESGIGRENGVEAFEACEFGPVEPLSRP